VPCGVRDTFISEGRWKEGKNLALSQSEFKTYWSSLACNCQKCYYLILLPSRQMLTISLIVFKDIKNYNDEHYIRVGI